jgi:hypothetical protein
MNESNVEACHREVGYKVLQLSCMMYNSLAKERSAVLRRDNKHEIARIEQGQSYSRSRSLVLQLHCNHADLHQNLVLPIEGDIVKAKMLYFRTSYKTLARHSYRGQTINLLEVTRFTPCVGGSPNRSYPGSFTDLAQR